MSAALEQSAPGEQPASGEGDEGSSTGGGLAGSGTERQGVSEGAGRGVYIVSPVYDWVWFLLPPLVSLVFFGLTAGTAWTDSRFWLGGKRLTPAVLSVSALTSAHLLAVVLRSHGNPKVFGQHRFRFIAVPILVFGAMMMSDWAACVATVVVIFWDTYHSALQTFGLARIYDRNAGNPPALGRWLDLGLNLILYLGPIVGGATMIFHFKGFEVFEAVESEWLSGVPARMQAHHGAIARGVLGVGAAYVAVYVAGYFRLARRGYKLCVPKVFLLSTTGLVSVWAWGWNPWGQAFLIMNLFHAVQYLALVWWSEGRRVRTVLRVGESGGRKAAFGGVLLSVLLGYGVWAELVPNDDRLRWSIVQTVALMHFYYDGFIWSVRRREI
ncbi:MAG: hypothetical protein R3B70_36360 [Polyangiaceae bacterium]